MTVGVRCPEAVGPPSTSPCINARSPTMSNGECSKSDIRKSAHGLRLLLSILVRQLPAPRVVKVLALLEQFDTSVDPCHSSSHCYDTFVRRRVVPTGIRKVCEEDRSRSVPPRVDTKFVSNPGSNKNPSRQNREGQTNIRWVPDQAGFFHFLTRRLNDRSNSFRIA